MNATPAMAAQPQRNIRQLAPCMQLQLQLKQVSSSYSVCQLEEQQLWRSYFHNSGPSPQSTSQYQGFKRQLRVTRFAPRNSSTHLWKSRLVSLSALLNKHSEVGISLKGFAMAPVFAAERGVTCCELRSVAGVSIQTCTEVYMKHTNGYV